MFCFIQSYSSNAIIAMVWPCLTSAAALQDRRLGTSLRDRPHIGFADMPLPGGRGSQELFDDFGAELAGGQQEDRLKAEMIELEKRSACVFEAPGVDPSVGPSGGLHSEYEGAVRCIC